MTREEAIKVVRNIYQTDAEKEALGILIPELKESEDEGVIRAINNILPFIPDEAYANNGVTKEGVLNWLEKQKEEEGYEAIPVESTLEYKLGFKAGKESEKQKEQKPAESEQNPLVKMLEDKKAITEDIRNGIPTKIIEKERNVKFATPVDVSHVEWNEEDEKMLDEIIRDVMTLHNAKNLDELKDKINFLKSLRPSWKPSEHQMTILKAVKNYVGVGSGYWGEALGSLIEDLEKLI